MNIWKKALLGAAISFGLAGGPAKAATYNILFDDAFNGAGVDYTGVFTSDPFAIPTAFDVTIRTTHFSVINGGYFPAYFDPALFLYGASGGGFPGVVTNIPVQAGAFSLALYNTRTWQIQNCYSSQDCHDTLASGSYSINPVPLPAALPLLAAGLSAMGFMGWRRKRRAA